jgi:hypothetical protein
VERVGTGGGSKEISLVWTGIERKRETELIVKRLIASHHTRYSKSKPPEAKSNLNNIILYITP